VIADLTVKYRLPRGRYGGTGNRTGISHRPLRETMLDDWKVKYRLPRGRYGGVGNRTWVSHRPLRETMLDQNRSLIVYC